MTTLLCVNPHPVTSTRTDLVTVSYREPITRIISAAAPVICGCGQPGCRDRKEKS